MSLARQRLLIFFVPILLSLPFLGRALFVDDAFFVRIASWIKDHPTRPYDFPDEGATGPSLGHDRSLRIVNPLLHHYYLAGWMKIAGDHEGVWRFGCVLLAGAGLVCVFELARRWTGHALLATLLVAVAPAHWLTAHSLLIDSTLGAFFFAALLFFVRWMEHGATRDAVTSGIFIGCTMLTKYTGVLIFPLTGALVWWQRRTLRRPWGAAIAWGIGGALFGVYFLMTRALYGAGHAWAASQQTLHLTSWAKLVVLMVFFSGVSAGPALVWATLSRRSILIGALAVLAGTSLTATTLGGFSSVNAFLFSFLFITSMLFFWRAARWLPNTQTRSDRAIGAWLFGFIAMMAVVMAWVAGRYFVIVVPAAVFAGVRLVEEYRLQAARRILTFTIAATAALSAALAYADYQQAECGRAVVARLAALGFDRAPRRYYFAEEFSSAYLARAGWLPWDADTPLVPGDVIVTPSVTLPLGRFLSSHPPVREIAVVDFPARFPLRVMDGPAGAGFYASAWGPLPFAVSSGPYERFFVMEATPASTEKGAVIGAPPSIY